MANSIKILITGKSGSGKSILANGVFDCEVVEERHGIQRDVRSGEMDHYTSTIDGVLFEVWISSSLQDEVADEKTYLPYLKKMCDDVDLILYCIKMSESRFVRGNPDAQAIAKLTRTLGVECWKKAILVLTHGNIAASITHTADIFSRQVKSWKGVLHNTLIHEAGVPVDIVTDIPVVPTGHYNVPRLPDGNYWLSIFWSECCKRFSTLEVRQAMSNITLPKLKSYYDAEPIVVPSWNRHLSRAMRLYGAAKWPVVVSGIVMCLFFVMQYGVMHWLPVSTFVLTCGLALMNIVYTRR